MPRLARRSNDPQPAVGVAVRELRSERGLTQEALGLEAGIQPAWISHLEAGRVNPTWGTMRRLAAALGVSLTELAGRVEQTEAGGE